MPRIERKTTTEIQPRILSIGAAAKILGISTAALRSYAENGFIEYFRLPGSQRQGKNVGGHRRFTEESLNDFLKKAEEAGKGNFEWNPKPETFVHRQNLESVDPEGLEPPTSSV